MVILVSTPEFQVLQQPQILVFDALQGATHGHGHEASDFTDLAGEI